jgi:alkylation response protein AidB-like acyl-CoA dehydrogenase
MNFDFTDDQQAIKSTAHDFLADRFKPAKVRELAESGSYDDSLWQQMSELGWPGIFVAEEFAGQGLGVVELVILMEELGYVAAPSPFLSNAAAGLMVQHAGSSDQQARWLPGVASGEARGTVGVRGKDGSAPMVPDAELADFIVLVDGNSAVVVSTDEANVERVDTIDDTRPYSRVSASGGEALEGDVAGAFSRVAVALSGELVGLSQRSLDMAVEYAKDRQQFGRPIGAYQAVSHNCAQMLIEVEGARSLTYYAGWAADHEPESLAVAGSMAKAYASDAGFRVPARSLQVHGGIGFTWEHDLQFFLKRGKTGAHLYGTAREHRERVAELTGLGAVAAPA